MPTIHSIVYARLAAMVFPDDEAETVAAIDATIIVLFERLRPYLNDLDTDTLGVIEKAYRNLDEDRP